MNFGMIGMIGGVGAGLEKQGAFLAKQEDEDRAAARTQTLEEWRMKKRQEYEIAAEDRGEQRTIRSEGRSDTRDEAKKDRDFDRTQKEAPTRRDIEVANEKAKARGKSEVAAETVDQDAAVTRKQAEAKETPADKAVKDAHSGYYNSLGDKAERTDPNAKKEGAAKLDPADAKELADVQASVKEKRSMIDKGRVDGSWNDDALTPGQKKVQAELVAEQKRAQAILARNRTGAPAAPAAADPLGIRKPAPAASGGGMVGPAPTKGIDDSDRPRIINDEFRKAKARLASEQDPAARARLEQDVLALQNEAKRGGFPLNDAAPAATPVSAPAAMPLATAKTPSAANPAMPASGAPAQAGTAEAAVQQLTGKEAGAKPGGGDYATKAQALKARIAAPAAEGAAAPSAGAATPLAQAVASAGITLHYPDKLAAQEPALRQAAQELKAAQAQVVQAANGQNQQQTAQAMAQAQAAGQKIDALLTSLNMNPAGQKAIKSALGVI